MGAVAGVFLPLRTTGEIVYLDTGIRGACAIGITTTVESRDSYSGIGGGVLL